MKISMLVTKFLQCSLPSGSRCADRVRCVLKNWSLRIFNSLNIFYA